MKRARLTILALAFFLPVFGLASMARANCANPTNVAGGDIYNTTYHVRQFCNGTTWKAEGPTGGAPTSGLIGYWKLDESSSPAADSSGNGYTGTWQGGTAYTASGQINGALTFNGTDGDVSIADNAALRLTSAFTLSSWVKLNATPANTKEMVILEKDDTPGNNNYSLAVDNNANCGGGLSWTVWFQDSGAANYSDCYATAIATGTWYHVTGTWDGTNLKLYINGVLQQTTNAAGHVPTTGTTALWLGDEPFNPDYLDGTLDDVRIYNRALSATEVSALYGPHANCSNPTGPEGDEIYNKTYHVMQFCNGANWIAEAAVLTFDNGIVGWWKLDESSGTSAADSSGQGNSGTLINTATDWQVGKIANALNFDGVDDYVTAGSPAILDDMSALTVTAWIKPVNAGEGSAGWIVGKAGTGADEPNLPDGGWKFGFSTDAANSLVFAAEHSGSHLERASNANPLTMGVWSFVAVTWDGTTTAANARIYVNGAEISYSFSANASGSRVSDAAANLLIGNDAPTNGTFNGEIDDARVYNRVLSSAEISALYNSAPKVTWTKQLSAPNQSWTWAGLVSSSDGAKLAAALGFNGKIYTSTDSGVTWTAQAGSPSVNWAGMASSSDGAKLVAAAGSGTGQIYTSTDSGVTWTARDSNRAWTGAVGSSSDGTKLAATVYDGYIYTSTDSGVTWTQRATLQLWQGVASSSDGAKLVAIINGAQIYTSTDSGVTWTARDSSRDWISVASSSDGTKLVAAVDTPGYIYTSTDSGVTWTQQTGSGSRVWVSVASSSDGTKLIAGTNGDYIYISTDSGVTWTAQTSAGVYLTSVWEAVASSSDGAKLVATDGAPGYIWTGVSSGGGSCANPAGAEGQKTYNTTSSVMQVCNGTNWINTAW